MELNLTPRLFCKRIGIAYHSDILKELRNLNLVDTFKVGKKYMYKAEDALKISEMLHKKKIEIQTNNNRYYIKLNQ